MDGLSTTLPLPADAPTGAVRPPGAPVRRRGRAPSLLLSALLHAVVLLVAMWNATTDVGDVGVAVGPGHVLAVVVSHEDVAPVEEVPASAAAPDLPTPADIEAPEPEPALEADETFEVLVLPPAPAEHDASVIVDVTSAPLSLAGKRTKPSPLRAPVAPPAAPRTPARRAAARGTGPSRLIAVELPSVTADDYPVEARRMGVEGTAVVEVTVDVHGRVAAARVVGSSGSPLLDVDAPSKAARYRFLPIPAPVVARVRIRYLLH